jgi:hypothetical protein
VSIHPIAATCTHAAADFDVASNDRARRRCRPSSAKQSSTRHSGLIGLNSLRPVLVLDLYGDVVVAQHRPFETPEPTITQHGTHPGVAGEQLTGSSRAAPTS